MPTIDQLTDEEVRQVIDGELILIPDELIDDLMATKEGQLGFVLWSRIRVLHWEHEEFRITRDLMPPFGRTKMGKATRVLLRKGYLRQLRRARGNKPALYGWPKRRPPSEGVRNQLAVHA
jgi:hypothetical protein